MLDFLTHGIPFYKAQGSGNHFVVIDNRELAVPQRLMADWALRICRDGFGVGADGIFFLEAAPAGSGADIRWHFYNRDGSRAEMCGNGSRCAARLAHELAMAPAAMGLGTDVGVVRAQVLDGAQTSQVRVRLTPPQGFRRAIPVTLDSVAHELHFVDTGVPHAVWLAADVAALDVAAMGRAVRHHPAFAPKGTNANFVQVVDRGHLRLRTYERGVEAETYACGTGASAAAYVTHALGLTDGRVEVTTSGGEVLTIEVGEGELYLTGGAEIVFAGRLNPAALGLEWPFLA